MPPCTHRAGHLPQLWSPWALMVVTAPQHLSRLLHPPALQQLPMNMHGASITSKQPSCWHLGDSAFQA